MPDVRVKCEREMYACVYMICVYVRIFRDVETCPVCVCVCGSVCVCSPQPCSALLLISIQGRWAPALTHSSVPNGGADGSLPMATRSRHTHTLPHKQVDDIDSTHRHTHVNTL